VANWPNGGGAVDRPDWSVLRSMMDDLQRARRNLGDTQRKMLQIRGEARSEDRLIRAVVGPRGQLIDLELDPRIFRNADSKALATAILATVREAVDDSLRKSRELRDELLPKDLRKLAEGGERANLLEVQDAELEGELGGKNG
jgi:DNA-binding protein YbaB